MYMYHLPPLKATILRGDSNRQVLEPSPKAGAPYVDSAKANQGQVLQASSKAGAPYVDAKAALPARSVPYLPTASAQDEPASG